MKRRIIWGFALFVVGGFSILFVRELLIDRHPEVDEFMMLLDNEPQTVDRALQSIEANWHPGNSVMLLECDQSAAPGYFPKILPILEKQTGESPGQDMWSWYRWVWQRDYRPHPDYVEFKARLYERRDPQFREYFVATDNAKIRLDEILWGGVPRDGIPPLKDPKMLLAPEATYLADTDVVFGVSVGDDARAYPKRILAWHEMFKDTVGGESLCGVYCTLCGSMIAYKTVFEGTHHELGTSGFLYRSNKLMYDQETKSLWSTLKGEPVVGPLVGKGIQLEMHHVVTTTWDEWRRRHPNTKVLSTDTGFMRDYREGEAYKKYFADDQLMFHVPDRDQRLKNKHEILAIRFGESSTESLAISSRFLDRNPIYHDSVNGVRFVVLTDESGANRVYESTAGQFVTWDGEAQLLDEEGGAWQVEEESILGPNNQRLLRLPAHRAFWFGWHAAFPDTRLVK